MNDATSIRECELAEGIVAVISDVSRHYFGGYYHIRLQVTADVPLCLAWFGTAAEYEDALRQLGKSVRFSRILEKMAVPLDEVADVRNALLDSFEANLLGYLSRPDFPCRFVLSEYAKICKAVVPGRYAQA